MTSTTSEEPDLGFFEEHGGRPRACSDYDDDLLQLQFVLESPAGRAAFMDYCTAAFAAENVRFLTAAYDWHRSLMENFHKHPELRKEMRDNAMSTICSNYIVAGTPLEVNISHKIRSEILQQCETTTSDRSSLSSSREKEGFMETLASVTDNTVQRPRSARRRMALASLDTALPQLEHFRKSPTVAAARSPRRNISPSAKFQLNITTIAEDTVEDMLDVERQRRSTQTSPTAAGLKLTRSSRSTSCSSAETRDEEDLDEFIEWLRPAIVEVTNLVMRETWTRFRRSTYYDRFYELYLAAAQTVQLDAMADDRKHFNIVQVMNRHAHTDRSSFSARPSLSDMDYLL